MLAARDPILFDLLEREYRRQNETLTMVAASSLADPSVLACEAMPTTNVTTEGYPGARYHAGCGVVDQIEDLAIQRAMRAFGARFANVQPHSGSSANEIVLGTVLKPGDTILGLDLNCGGHLTHGSKASISGQWFNAVAYGLDANGYLSYDEVAELAERHRPRLIISARARIRARSISAASAKLPIGSARTLLADISHIAGLVAGGVHPSPIDHAHFTTTSTYKQLFDHAAA
jgi:glycine hydroxymethyltransferase